MYLYYLDTFPATQEKAWQLYWQQSTPLEFKQNCKPLFYTDTSCSKIRLCPWAPDSHMPVSQHLVPTRHFQRHVSSAELLTLLPKPVPPQILLALLSKYIQNLLLPILPVTLIQARIILAGSWQSSSSWFAQFCYCFNFPDRSLNDNPLKAQSNQSQPHLKPKTPN